MKTFVVTLMIICVAATAGTLLYSKCHKTPPLSAPPVELSPKPAEPAEQALPEEAVVPRQEPPRGGLDPARKPAPILATTSSASDLKSDGETSALSRSVDILVSPQASFNDRRALWQKLKEAGELDRVIADLRQRAQNNPNDPAIPTALGVGLMNKFPVGDFNETAILGLQIDQSFDAALKLDPANWEAQYEKANSMSYWPDVAGKSPEIIQRLASLAGQQEAMTPEPQFAKTYILLGDRYKKAGRLDDAQQTWQRGAQQFPNDPTLQKRIAGLSRQ